MLNSRTLWPGFTKYTCHAYLHVIDIAIMCSKFHLKDLKTVGVLWDTTFHQQSISWSKTFLLSLLYHREAPVHVFRALSLFMFVYNRKQDVMNVAGPVPVTSLTCYQMQTHYSLYTSILSFVIQCANFRHSHLQYFRHIF